jgi:KDO2-lipid IV(A) lauroyltransferase
LAFRKKIVYLFEYGLVLVLYHLLRLFSLRTASTIGGFLGRLCLRFFRLTVTKKNLNWVFPNLNITKKKQIIRDFHDNYGRNFVEYFFLDRLENEPTLSVNIKTPDLLEKILLNNQPKIVITAHYGNWEIALWALSQAGFPLNPIYRKINNTYIDNLILNLRGNFTEQQIKKGPNAGKESFRLLKKGKNLVLLIDQKMQEGLAVPLFGKPAMTPNGAIKLAMLANAQIIPGRIIRKQNLEFDLFLEEPIEYDKNSPTVEYDTLLTINQILERWILEHPEQWFWFHRRFEKLFYDAEHCE